jgi:putative ABC transport system permease protein
VLRLFLLDAIVIAAGGGLLGLVAGAGGAQLLHFFIPVLPVRTPRSFVVAAELLAIGIGLAAGALPARRASRVTPVTALQAE